LNYNSIYITYGGDETMGKRVLSTFSVVPVILLNGNNGWHMMDGGHMDWWGFPFMGIGMIGLWLFFVIIAFLVYKDAEERGMNGLLWLVLVILPWLGILFLVIYLIIREDRTPLSQKSAKAILNERYARGEITNAEYLQMKKDIEGDKTLNNGGE
jgi:putative membrane protein